MTVLPCANNTSSKSHISSYVHLHIPLSLPSLNLYIKQSNATAPKTIPNLILEAFRTCDPELRQVLMGNVVLTGGGSLLNGFSERLASELSRSFSHVRFLCCLLIRHLFNCSAVQSWLTTIMQVKIHAPGNPTERRYGGWLGGSILASLGTFHQLWISREEWQVRPRQIVVGRDTC